MKKTLFTLVIVLIACVIVKAQSATATSIVTAKIPVAMQVAVTDGAVVNFDFTGQTASLTTGIQQLNAVILTYSSNTPWYININATTPNFSGGSLSAPMPSSVLQFRNNAGGTYAPLGTTPLSLKGTTGAKIPPGASTLGIDIKMVPGNTVIPATDYTIGIMYTLSCL
ncbi:hypothetical protein [Mucilaginibacter sp.]|uniref:hypothetical protein n=1 Tax=Mucilaginibacter sp. TaxID=1882438 RepID=UPI0026211383|nr:hypothetical protein [Mucilaginibacter sp.]MDB5031179.1 hypothetical protein [Mucilaginibacter sp.]